MLLLTNLAHEIWTTLSGDGTKGPFFVRTSEKKLAEMKIFLYQPDAFLSYVPILTDPKSKKNISPGERATLAYLRYMIIESKFIEPGDILIVDAESALSTDIVQRYLFQNRIYPFVLPSTHHQLLNPCDNSFHSLFKQRYYREISSINYGNIAVKEKFNLAKKCYHDISVDAVEGMFRRCGLINSERSKRSIVVSLACEGISSLEKHNNHHKLCLLTFLKWCRTNNLLKHLCPFGLKNVVDIV